MADSPKCSSLRVLFLFGRSPEDGVVEEPKSAVVDREIQAKHSSWEYAGDKFLGDVTLRG